MDTWKALRGGRFADAATLVDELIRFRVKIDPFTAHDSYGAWREGEHDDLVLATAVACWYGLKTYARACEAAYPLMQL